MFDHVTIRVADRDASLRFYDTALGALGIERTHSNGEFVEWDDFGLAAATADKPPTTGLHVVFAAASQDAVDAFRRAGSEAGCADDGAFLLDPDGNNVELVNHNRG